MDKNNPEFKNALLKAVSYNPQTGLFWWNLADASFIEERNHRIWNTMHAGRAAFDYENGDGYLTGTFRGVGLISHRLAWLSYSGDWPDGLIDHIDGDRHNNKISNLRVVDLKQNAANRKSVVGSRSRFVGVYLNCGVWRAQIQINTKKVYLGNFDTQEEAALARDKAAWAKSGEFAKLNIEGKNYEEKYKGNWSLYASDCGLPNPTD